mgnify:CR=1 FL=1
MRGVIHTPLDFLGGREIIAVGHDRGCLFQDPRFMCKVSLWLRFAISLAPVAPVLNRLDLRVSRWAALCVALYFFINLSSIFGYRIPPRRDPITYADWIPAFAGMTKRQYALLSNVLDIVISDITILPRREVYEAAFRNHDCFFKMSLFLRCFGANP